MRFPKVLLLAALLLPSVASADILPDNHKSVKLSIRVEAEVPAEQTLILANTFRGASLVVPGSTENVDWHPARGDMQIRMITASDQAKLEKLSAAQDYDAIEKMVFQSIACHKPFPGVRTVETADPTDEIRWFYEVTVAEGTCAARLLRTEHLDAAGKVLQGGEPASAEEATASAAVGDKASKPATQEAPASSVEKKSAPAESIQSKGRCSFVGGRSAPFGWLMLAMLMVRRRQG